MKAAEQGGGFLLSQERRLESVCLSVFRHGDNTVQILLQSTEIVSALPTSSLFALFLLLD